MVFTWRLSDSKSQSILQDYSLYCSRSQQCCSLDGLQIVLLFPIHSHNQTFGDFFERPNYNYYLSHLNIRYIFQFSCKVEVLIFLVTFYQSYLVIIQNGKIYNSATSLFLLTITMSGRLVECELLIVPLHNK